MSEERKRNERQGQDQTSYGGMQIYVKTLTGNHIESK